MNFVESVKTCFTKYATFSGRASRSEFWWWCLFTVVLRIAANILDMILISISSSPIAFFSLVAVLGTLLPSIAVTARRLHDVDKSGWWQLLVITLIGLIPLLIWWVKKSDEGSNRFGDSPVKS